MKTTRMSCVLVLAPLLALAGCTSSQSLQPPSPGPQISSDGQCHADRVAWAVGQPATQEVMARVWKESGAGLIRPLAPGQAATHDYKPDRINVLIDKSNIITQVNCG
ncbi:MAG TPA: I78 family peptidase inhibitor [Stenotrophomonas sp.]|nr:I78 family peptidase inhibitor [Stenotrophomonas sp.]